MDRFRLIAAVVMVVAGGVSVTVGLVFAVGAAWTAVLVGSLVCAAGLVGLDVGGDE